MNTVGWFQIVAGAAIIGLWVVLLITRQVPQIPAGDRDIWFHLTAELLTGVLLVGAGLWLLAAASDTARTLSALALGALLYTAINSPGYYADRGERTTVAVFVVLATATATAGAALVVTAA